MRLEFGAMDNATLDIMFDFFGCLLKNVLIKKEIELQKILRHSPYGKSGKIPFDLCSDKMDLMVLCNYLQPMMRLVRGGASKQEFDWKCGFVIDNMVRVTRLEVAVSIADIIYDWKATGKRGVVSILCRLTNLDDIKRALDCVIANETNINVQAVL